MARVSEQLKGEIARILREEARDPRLSLVTLTRVDVAPDLRSALVFWSVLDVSDGAPAEVNEESHTEEVQRGLDAAASFVRARLAHELPLKRVPELRFRYDPSLSLGSETLSLLRSISDDDEA